MTKPRALYPKPSLQMRLVLFKGLVCVALYSCCFGSEFLHLKLITKTSDISMEPIHK